MSSQSTLTSLLLKTPYTLAYALPLLFISLLLTFSGTFLTLDRTRAFHKNGDGYQSVVVPGSYEYGGKKRGKWWKEWRLEGGVGGLSMGWCFGVHLSTFLSLLIPVTTSSSSLGRKSFLAVWVLCCIATTTLAARYRHVALVFISISGGALSSLSLSILLHPSLPTRIILTSILIPLFLLLTFVFSIPRLAPRFLHAFLRISTSASGAFGVVVAIALLSKPPIEGWANAWERLWVRDGADWGVGKERGLSAAWGILFILGMLCDWALKRWVGECPDEKWDACLAFYASSLPHRPDRAGIFKPAQSFWDRWFPTSQPLPGLKDDMLFPSESDMKSSLPLTHSPLTHSETKLTKVHPSDEPLDSPIPQPVGFLKKSRTQKKERKLKCFMDGARDRRPPVKFGEFSDSDEEEEKGEGLKRVDARLRPFVIQNLGSYSYASSQSERTLVGDGGSKRSSGSLGKGLGPSASEVDVAALPVLDIDYDEDLEKLKAIRRGFDDEDYSDWEDGAPRRVSSPPPAFLQHNPASNNPSSAQGMLVPPIPGSVPVPATPSLIRAVERIVSAQREVFGIPQPQPTPWPLPPSPGVKHTPSVKQMSLPDVKHTPSPPLPGVSPVHVSMRPEGLPRTHTSPNIPVAEPFEEEDAEDIDLEHGQPWKAERTPRWEEFWREVRVKASGVAGEEVERPERAVAR